METPRSDTEPTTRMDVTTGARPTEGKPAASIIVPTFREAGNLRPLVTAITASMRTTGEPFEIIIVDDDSQDGSVEIVNELASEGHPVRMIVRVGERGLSSAVLRGFQESAGAYMICMDADLSHPPDALPRLIQVLSKEKAEFVIGSRYVKGASTDETWGVFRWINSKVATTLARPFTSAGDPMAGFFGLPRAVFDRAEALDPIGYKIGLELIVKCRCREVREIPIHFANRRVGRSKLNLKEQLNYLRHLGRLAAFRWRRPDRPA
jgi:dolichol-phosphate mannosyltransferase